jgi:hypothetical protein
MRKTSRRIDHCNKELAFQNDEKRKTQRRKKKRTVELNVKQKTAFENKEKEKKSKQS